jgi:hypothetical protein
MSKLLQLLLIGSLGALLIGCNTTNNVQVSSSDQSPNPTNNFEHTVRGMILEVTAKSALELNELWIQDGQEKNWVFKGKGFAGKTPAHLRQHSLLGQLITVFYKEDDLGTLVITHIID